MRKQSESGIYYFEGWAGAEAGGGEENAGSNLKRGWRKTK